MDWSSFYTDEVIKISSWLISIGSGETTVAEEVVMKGAIFSAKNGKSRFFSADINSNQILEHNVEFEIQKEMDEFDIFKFNLNKVLQEILQPIFKNYSIDEEKTLISLQKALGEFWVNEVYYDQSELDKKGISYSEETYTAEFNEVKNDPFGDEENGQKTFVAYGYCYGFEDEKCICDYEIDKEEIFEIAKQLCNQGISATLKAKNVDCEYEGIYYFDI